MSHGIIFFLAQLLTFRENPSKYSMNTLADLLRKIFASSAFKYFNFDEKRKALLLYAFFAAAVVLFLFFIPVNIIQENYSFLYIDGASLVLITLMLYALYRFKAVQEISYIFSIAVIAVSFYFFISGGVEATGPFYSLLVPIPVIFLLGARKGTAVSFFYVSICSVIYLAGDGKTWFPSYFPSYMLRYLLLYFNIIIVTALVEAIIKVLYRQLQERNEELQRNEKKLNDAVTMRDRFFTVLAHDLKSPLSGLHDFLNMHREDIENLSPEEIQGALQLATDSSKLIYDLLMNLLNWGRIQLDVVSFKAEEHQIINLIDEAVSVCLNQAEKKEIDIDVEVEDNTILHGDADMISAVFRNLLSNAIKFSYPGSRISISVERGETFHTITVSDNGTGMNEERKELLFEGDRIEPGRGTRNEKGTGLGLIICREFIVKNGGTLSIKSSEGAGTSVTFTVPGVSPGTYRHN